MLPVSDRFKQTVSQNNAVATVITATPPGGGLSSLQFSSGSWAVDRTQRIRRTASLAVKGGSDLFEMLSIPGCRVAVDHGFSWSGRDRELVPIIRGELSSAALQLGDGLISISIADLWQGLAAANYLAAYSPDVTSTRVSEIIRAVTDVYPGIAIQNTATDTGAVATAQAWTSRADMVTAFAADGGTDAYFAPDGSFIIRDLPQVTDPVSWLIKTGDGGTLKALTRTRPLDKVYNAVVLTPATADASQDWTQVVVVIDDLSNPRHPARLGRTVPFTYSAPTLLTEDEALAVAQQLLVKVQGSTETLSIDAKSNPALEGGDIVRVLTPIDGGRTIVNHFLDSFSGDLVTGGMSCGTRASEEVAA